MAMKKLSIWTVTGVGLLVVGLAFPWGAVSDAGATLPWIIYLQLLFATGFLTKRPRFESSEWNRKAVFASAEYHQVIRNEPFLKLEQPVLDSRYL